MTHYIALIHKEPGSGFGVSFPDVPGVTAVADSLDEAMQEGAIALGFAFEDWDGVLPVQRTLDQLRSDPAFVDQTQDAVVAVISPVGQVSQAA